MDRAANRLTSAHGSAPAANASLTATDKAQPPSRSEYASIREALMSTTRGRWFLDEYARANRHADTRAVLDAVERLERAVAGQVLAPSAQAIPAAIEASEAVSRSLLRERLGTLTAALAAREDAVGPLERTTQKFQTVIWTLREGGADLRLCDLLETQLNAIREAHKALGAADAAIISVMESLCGELGLTVDASLPDETISVQPVTKAVTAAVEATAAALDITVSVPVVEKPRPAPPQPASSLGAAVLASGLVRATQSDPLAALARMTQAEKIALFT